MKYILAITAFFCFSSAFAQDYRWQQEVKYDMEIDVDADKHQYDGKQKITYTNNSPDHLDKVYYHLYFNAFQPNSMMDQRNLALSDSDGRVGSRISKLGNDEIGWQKIHWMKQDGKKLSFDVKETVMQVNLATPLAPGESTVLEMEWDAQVPVQIRRSGRDNKEGVEFSMAQWYPKLAEYDYQGWHAYPYIGREFHGVWGDFDVKIKMDSDYIIGGSGVIQNPNDVPGSYGSKMNKKGKGKKTTWHFIAEDVIDFAWAADPDYTHDKIQVPNGPLVHFFYQKNSKTEENWKLLKDKYTIPMFQNANAKFGKYPHSVYSFIQGGDGGMEYPMCTLITGERNLKSLVGVAVHELFHSWYQMNLASNESLYAWMDEGFTSYASNEIENILFEDNAENAHKGSLATSAMYRKGDRVDFESGMQHSDRFSTNAAYGINSYVQGAALLTQLRYMMGDEIFEEAMINYYNQWKGKHPEPFDFIRSMEKTADMNLAWFQRLWINTDKQIDYNIEDVKATNGKKGTQVTLSNDGEIPMPTEVTVTLKNGKEIIYYAPLSDMWGEKQFSKDQNVVVLEDWPWTNPEFTFTIDKPMSEIANIELDKGGWTADTNRDGNSWKKNVEN